DAPATEAVGDELAIQIPERQSVALDVEGGVLALHILERVDVGHEVTAHPEAVDEVLHARRLVDVLGDIDGDIAGPADGSVGDAQGREDALVETALADEQLVHLLEVLARARTLNDTVVVGARERDGLADAE